MLSELSIEASGRTDYQVKVTFWCDDRGTADEFIADASAGAPIVREQSQLDLQETKRLHRRKATPHRIRQIRAQLRWSDDLHDLILSHEPTPPLVPLLSTYSDSDSIFWGNRTPCDDPRIRL